MIRGGDNRQRIGRKSRCAAIQFCRSTSHHNQIDFIARHQADDVVAVFDFELDFNPRKQFAKLHQQHRNKVFGGTHDGEVDAPLFQTNVFGHDRFQIFQACNRGDGVGQKRLSGVSQADIAPKWFDQRHTKRIFELANLHRHGGLGYRQAFCRLGNRILAGNFQKSLNLLEGVRTHNYKFFLILWKIFLILDDDLGVFCHRFATGGIPNGKMETF